MTSPVDYNKEWLNNFAHILEPLAQEKDRKNLTVVVEMDGDKRIKNIEVHHGNWLSRTFFLIKKHLTPEKHYHYGTRAVLKDLSHIVKDMTECMQQPANKTNQDKIKNLSETARPFLAVKVQIGNLSKTIFKDKAKELTAQVEVLTHSRNCVFDHAVIMNEIDLMRRDCLDNGNVVKGKEQKLLEHARKAFVYRNMLLSEPNVPQNLQIEVEEALKIFPPLLIDLAFNKRIDATETPFTHLEKIVSLRQQFDLTAGSRENNPVLFLEAGIRFIKEFYSLKPQEKEEFKAPLEEMKKRFDKMNFLGNAKTILSDYKIKLEDFKSGKLNPEHLAEFQESFQFFLTLSTQLGTLLETISDDHSLRSLNQQIGTLYEELNVKLRHVAKDQLQHLYENFHKEAETLLNDLTQLKHSETQLEIKIESQLNAERSHQEMVNSILTGKPKDLAALLTVPQGLSKARSDFVCALAALVRFARAESATGPALEKQKQELDRLLSAAGLVKPEGTTALAYLLNPKIAASITKLLEVSYQELPKAQLEKEKTKNLYEQAHLEAKISFSDRIEQKKQQLQSLLTIERASIKNAIGSAQISRMTEEEAKTALDALFEIENADLSGHYREIYDVKHDETKQGYPEEFNRFLLRDILEDVKKRNDRLSQEITAFESLEHPEFYDMSLNDLHDLLKRYEGKYRFEHFPPNSEDIIRASIKLPLEKAQLLSSETAILLELAAAYKEKQAQDDIVKLRDRSFLIEEGKLLGWELLSEGLQLLAAASQSYAAGIPLSQQVQALKHQAAKERTEMENIQNRERFVKERMEILKQQLNAQVDILSATAVDALLREMTFLQQSI